MRKSPRSIPLSSWARQASSLITEAPPTQQELMMNTGKFLYHAALVFGLAATGTGFAQVTPGVDPSQMTQEQREAYRAQRQSEMSAMTPEQRETYRAQRQAEMSAMTPEQRAEAQASRGQGGAARGQGQGTMARDGSGSGGQYGRAGGQGGGARGRGR